MTISQSTRNPHIAYSRMTSLDFVITSGNTSSVIPTSIMHCSKFHITSTTGCKSVVLFKGVMTACQAVKLCSRMSNPIFCMYKEYTQASKEYVDSVRFIKSDEAFRFVNSQHD